MAQVTSAKDFLMDFMKGGVGGLIALATVGAHLLLYQDPGFVATQGLDLEAIGLMFNEEK
jgi:hypothetical protein